MTRRMPKSPTKTSTMTMTTVVVVVMVLTSKSKSEDLGKGITDGNSSEPVAHLTVMTLAARRSLVSIRGRSSAHPASAFKCPAAELTAAIIVVFRVCSASQMTLIWSTLLENRLRRFLLRRRGSDFWWRIWALGRRRWICWWRRTILDAVRSFSIQ